MTEIMEAFEKELREVINRAGIKQFTEDLTHAYNNNMTDFQKRRFALSIVDEILRETPSELGEDRTWEWLVQNLWLQKPIRTGILMYYRMAG